MEAIVKALTKFKTIIYIKNRNYVCEMLLSSSNMLINLQHFHLCRAFSLDVSLLRNLLELYSMVPERNSVYDRVLRMAECLKESHT